MVPFIKDPETGIKILSKSTGVVEETLIGMMVVDLMVVDLMVVDRMVVDQLVVDLMVVDRMVVDKTETDSRGSPSVRFVKETIYQIDVELLQISMLDMIL